MQASPAAWEGAGLWATTPTREREHEAGFPTPVTAPPAYMSDNLPSAAARGPQPCCSALSGVPQIWKSKYVAPKQSKTDLIRSWTSGIYSEMFGWFKERTALRHTHRHGCEKPISLLSTTTATRTVLFRCLITSVTGTGP